MAKAIGIDLGTTNTVAAEAREGLAGPKAIMVGSGSFITRSAIALVDGEWVVGTEAEGHLGISPSAVIRSSKRFIGLAYGDKRIAGDTDKLNSNPTHPRVVAPPEGVTEVRFRVYPQDTPRHTDISPTEVASVILRQVKRHTQETLGEEVTHATITVPAYFDAARIEATRKAGEAAGFHVQRIISEPQAAALAYGAQLDADTVETVLVYDFGGGTFDVTVVAVGQQTCVELAKTGDNHLGGDDVDARLLDLVLQKLRTAGKTPDEAARFNLLVKCREAKETLCLRQGDNPTATILVTDLAHAGDTRTEITISRQEFEGLIVDLVDKTMRLTDEALSDAKFTPDQIDRVLLIGGSTFIPLVRDRLRAKFGAARVRVEVDPMHAVALGAARLAQSLPLQVQCPKCHADQAAGNRQCDVCGASLSQAEVSPQLLTSTASQLQVISTLSRDIRLETDEGNLVPVLARGTQFSATTGQSFESKRVAFRISRSGVRFLTLAFYEGEGTKPGDNANLYSEITLEQPLPPDIRQGEDVNIECRLNGDGTIVAKVEVRGVPQQVIVSPDDWRGRITGIIGKIGPDLPMLESSPEAAQVRTAYDHVQRVVGDPGATAEQGMAALHALEGAIQEIEMASLDTQLQALRRSLYIGSLMIRYGSQWLDRLPLVNDVNLRELLIGESQLLGALRSAVTQGRQVDAQDNRAAAPRAAERIDSLVHASDLLWPLTLAEHISETPQQSSGGGRAPRIGFVTPEELERIRQHQKQKANIDGTAATQLDCAEQVAVLLKDMHQTIVNNTPLFYDQFDRCMQLVSQFFAAAQS